MVGRQVRSRVPRDWEETLKSARIELLALFRAIDRLPLDARELHQPTLHELFDIDGDCAEALWILDEPSEKFDMGRMMRDTRRSLGRLAETRARLIFYLPPPRAAELEAKVQAVRATLTAQDGWHAIPGKDPTAGEPLGDE
jgi:hypothetical protein